MNLLHYQHLIVCIFSYPKHFDLFEHYLHKNHMNYLFFLFHCPYGVRSSLILLKTHWKVVFSVQFDMKMNMAQYCDILAKDDIKPQKRQIFLLDLFQSNFLRNGFLKGIYLLVVHGYRGIHVFYGINLHFYVFCPLQP